jgi:hypothetical protein
VFGARSDRAEAASVCSGSDALVETRWNDDVKSRAASAFGQSDLPFGDSAWAETERRIDGYVAEWSESRTDACEATRVTGEQSDSLLDRRMRCYDERLAEVGALADVFASADPAVVEKAVNAAGRLSDLDGCADLDQLSTRFVEPQADLRDLVTHVRMGLAESKAHQDAGQYRRTLLEVESLALLAGAAGYRPLEAEAQYRLAAIRVLSSHYEAAETAANESVIAATASGHDVTEADAWTHLIYIAI